MVSTVVIIIGIALALEAALILANQKAARKAFIKLAKSKHLISYALLELIIGLALIIAALMARFS